MDPVNVYFTATTIMLVLRKSKKSFIPYLPYGQYKDACAFVYSSEWVSHDDDDFQMLILAGVKEDHPLGSLLLACKDTQSQPVINHKGPRGPIEVKPRMVFDGKLIHGFYVKAFKTILANPRYSNARAQSFLKAITAPREASDGPVKAVKAKAASKQPDHADIARAAGMTPVLAQVPSDAIHHLRNCFRGVDEDLQEATSLDLDCTAIVETHKHLLNALKSAAKSNDLAICLACVKSDAYDWCGKPGEPCPTCAAVLRA